MHKTVSTTNQASLESLSIQQQLILHESTTFLHSSNPIFGFNHKTCKVYEYDSSTKTIKEREVKSQEDPRNLGLVEIDGKMFHVQIMDDVEFISYRRLG